MSCERFRDRLLDDRPSSEALDHLGGCPACARFARRAAALRRTLREHHADVEPDPGFAPRVAGRVRAQVAHPLGRAALRLLPATLIAVLVLGWLASHPTVDPVETAAVSAADGQATTEDVLSWILEDEVE